MALRLQDLRIFVKPVVETVETCVFLVRLFVDTSYSQQAREARIQQR